jgi:hypothetical protein
MAVIFPILSTFDAAGVNKAQRAFKGLSGVAKAGTIAFAALGAASLKYGADAVSAAASDQQAQLKLAKTLENVTGATDGAIAATEKFITEQQFATGVSDTQLRPALENLVRATGDVTKAQELLTLGLDVSAGSGRDLESISLALAKAQGGQFTALQRLGIMIPETVKKSKDFTKVQEYLNELFGGQAAVAADTYAGKMKILRERLGETQETLGSALLPVLTKFADFVIQNIMPGLEVFINALTGNQSLSSSFSDTQRRAFEFGNVVRAIVQTVVNYIPFLVKFGAALVGMFVVAKVAAAAGAIIKIVGGLVTAFQTLRKVGLAATIATAFATGGLSVAAGAAGTVAALAAIAVGFAALDKVTDKYKENVAGLPPIVIAPDGVKNDVKDFKDVVLPTLDETAKGAGKVATEAKKATTAVKGLSEEGKNSQKRMAFFNQELKVSADNILKLEDDLKSTTGVLETAIDKFNDFKNGVKNAIEGVLNFGTAQNQSADSVQNAKDAQFALTKAQEEYDKTLKTDNIEAQQKALEDLQAAQTAATDSVTKKKSFIQVLQDQAALASTFAGKVQTLITMGLSETAIGQVLAAGADAGTKIADEIIAGGSTVVDQVNTLVSATSSVATQVGDMAATEFYSAGVIAGQALVDGVKQAIADATSMFDALKASAAAAGFTIDESGKLVNTGAQKQVADKLRQFRGKKSESGTKLSKQERQSIIDLANSLGVEIPAMAAGGIVTKPTLALIGEAGPEAVVPLSGRGAGMGTTINLTVNAGMGADGASIGREIVDIIKRYERVSGPVFASA